MRAVLSKPSREVAVMSDGILMLDAEFEARVKRDEPMSRHTSWHVGGPADVFFSPRDRADLLAFLRTLPEGTPLFWLGLGSNLLVRDGGIRGVVIDTHGGLDAPRARQRHHASPAKRACRARGSRASASSGASARRNSSPAFPARSAARSR